MNDHLGSAHIEPLGIIGRSRFKTGEHLTGAGFGHAAPWVLCMTAGIFIMRGTSALDGTASTLNLVHRP